MTAISNYLDSVFPTEKLILPALNFVVSLALLAVLFAAIYKVLPDRELQWRDVITGAVVTSLLFTVGKSLIGGGLIIMLLWVYYSAQTFLLGAEFTKVYANRHGSKQDKPVTK